MEINEATRQFVRQHADEDVRQLALRFAQHRSQGRKGGRDGATDSDAVDLPLALDQIRGRQVARRKLPSWAAVDGLIYPPHLSMEQCSSEPTAQYKARLLARLVDGWRADGASGRDMKADGASLIDLTGGFGVDFAFMAQAVDRAVYVERSALLCDIARHNFVLLGLENAEVVCGEAESFATTPNPSIAFPPAKAGTATFGSPEEGTPMGDFAGVGNAIHALLASGKQGPCVCFLDPARRDEHGGRTYGIADCTPNVLLLRDELFKMADFIVLKLSPMLDWRAAVSELGRAQVAEVHIVSVDNECKELLLVMRQSTDETALFGVNLSSRGASSAAETFWLPSIADVVEPLPYADPVAGQYLYEPNASLMKAGCFNALSQRYGVAPIAKDSHLFVSPVPVSDFPGRKFLISAISSMNRYDFGASYPNRTCANIATRNFPMKAEELRRRLKLRDGGDTYIFGTTLSDGRHVLIISEKAPF